MSSRTAAEVRAGLDHPIVDGDGHWVEYQPVVMEAMRRIGGDIAAEGFTRFGQMIGDNVALTTAQRRARNLGHEAFWAVPTANTLDRATAMMPALLNDRLDELGIDFTVLYPTQGLGIVNIRFDDDMRRAACRAYNTFTADYFAPFARRMTPAAVIPMYSPQEAIAELDHAVGELGLKAAMFGSMIPRPLGPPFEGADGGPVESVWLDVLGLDSAHDYDPVWQRCLDLGVSPSFHANGRGVGFGLRAAPSNFTYNHIGHFAAAGEAVCKALFLGGVTHRFPALRFAFLEGGVAWACQLLNDIVEHWELRNPDALANLDPRRLNHDLLNDLGQRYGTPEMQQALAARMGRPPSEKAGLVGGRPAPDDFAACGITSVDDIRQRFVEPFWFGCEAEDRLSTFAFKSDYLPLEAKLNATLGSDIGHFDVSDMTRVIPEAHELVEHGLMAPDDFRRFAFTNAVRFFGGGNPRFFEGTSVEAEAAAVLAAEG
ncbi:MAG: amidohydrolase [Acidimicrobiia bacterium]|nr:amidohydrolase [Acidimicrobiia bacterium]MDH4363281.1 amidohydrolase [Acidimicrobiia bacterium]